MNTQHTPEPLAGPLAYMVQALTLPSHELAKQLQAQGLGSKPAPAETGPEDEQGAALEKSMCELAQVLALAKQPSEAQTDPLAEQLEHGRRLAVLVGHVARFYGELPSTGTQRQRRATQQAAAYASNAANLLAEAVALTWRRMNGTPGESGARQLLEAAMFHGAAQCSMQESILRAEDGSIRGEETRRARAYKAQEIEALAQQSGTAIHLAELHCDRLGLEADSLKRHIRAVRRKTEAYAKAKAAQHERNAAAKALAQLDGSTNKLAELHFQRLGMSVGNLRKLISDERRRQAKAVQGAPSAWAGRAGAACLQGGAA